MTAKGSLPGYSVPVDFRLKLLELTQSHSAVDMKDLCVLPQASLEEKLDVLDKNGLVTISNRVLSMNSQQRAMLAEQLIHEGVDPKRVTRNLGWQEFENFAEYMLTENRFYTRRHLIFKSSAGRREIDILAWNDTFTLAVDCKHWLKALTPGRIREAAQAQIERAAALAERPELLYRLKVTHPEGRSIIPVILALGEPHERLVDGVPVVSVSKLLNFIYGVSPINGSIRRIRVPDLNRRQLRLA
jgi:hypothetical protein